jgi:ribosome biogenesis ATPase
VRELIEHPIRHPEIYRHLGVKPPTGVLLHGPPGTGKTLLANAIAGELGVPFISISAPEIVSGFSGQSEKRIRTLFQEAQSKAPCIVFIDEIDAITPKRDSAQREMERRCLQKTKEKGICSEQGIVLFCKNCCAAADVHGQSCARGRERRGAAAGDCGGGDEPARLARSRPPKSRQIRQRDRNGVRKKRQTQTMPKDGIRKWFCVVFEVLLFRVPDTEGRARILKVLTRKLRLDGEFDYEALARGTPGFVGADLAALVRDENTMIIARRRRRKIRGNEKKEGEKEGVCMFSC